MKLLIMLLLCLLPVTAFAGGMDLLEQAVYQRQQEELSIELTAKAQKLKGGRGGACVTFVRNFLMASYRDVPSIARDTEINALGPEIGYLVKTQESQWGHVAVIIAIEEEYLVVVESNYSFKGIIGIRKIKKDDPKILGYRNI